LPAIFQTAIFNSGIAPAASMAIPPPFLLRVGSEEGRASAAGALHSLACDDNMAPIIVAAGAIPPLLALIQDGSDEGKENAELAMSI
jgi:vacuolar protein 8